MLYESFCFDEPNNETLQAEYEHLEDKAYRDDDYQTAREMEDKHQDIYIYIADPQILQQPGTK